MAIRTRQHFIDDLKGEESRRVGHLVEYSPTETIFTNPDDQRTEDYVTGKFG